LGVSLLQHQAETRIAIIIQITTTMLPYDRKDNPFNDPDLDKVFLWKKKAKALGWSKSEAKQRAEALREQNLKEIENAKRRRVERERELAERLAERERKERERDSESYAGWEQREEEFMLRQHQQASALRINQGRERPIDVVARNVLLTKQLRHGPEIGPDGKATALLGPDVGIENSSPLDLFPRLSRQDLLVLRDDISKYLQMESAKSGFKAFWEALLVICDDFLNPVAPDNPIPQIVRDSIQQSCSEKSVEEVKMERLDASKRARDSGAGSEESAFFIELEKRLAIEEARATVRKIHAEMVETATRHGRTVHNVQRLGDGRGDALPAQMTQEGEEDEDQSESAFQDVVEVPDVSTASKDANLVKPRYWNRVRTGYDWNKYNKAHYDRDNPPPKAVFGYRLNILYPGLKKAPRYVIERDKTDPEKYCIIRFIASAPFSDLAFRIENKEWDRSANSGYKSSFENGVLQLHFNFTRRRYRR